MSGRLLGPVVRPRAAPAVCVIGCLLAALRVAGTGGTVAVAGFNSRRCPAGAAAAARRISRTRAPRRCLRRSLSWSACANGTQRLRLQTFSAGGGWNVHTRHLSPGRGRTSRPIHSIAKGRQRVPRPPPRRLDRADWAVPDLVPGRFGQRSRHVRQYRGRKIDGDFVGIPLVVIAVS
jgi:hypothetical protein